MASGQRDPGLLLFVHLSSERTLEPVRRDCSFAEKQQPQAARLLVVRGGSPGAELETPARAE
jgi:hypothetical protein